MDVEDVMDVALYIYNECFRKKYRSPDEMKLHKLLYFAQRESLVRHDQPLFAEEFEGWKYGPVCVSVRRQYHSRQFEDEKKYTDIAQKLSAESRDIIHSVLKVYGEKESWSLSDITHGEYSWKQSRTGIRDGENGSNRMLLDDIRIDAARIRERRNRLKKADKAGALFNSASYVPVIHEEDLSAATGECVDVAEQIKKICNKLVRRAKDEKADEKAE